MTEVHREERAIVGLRTERRPRASLRHAATRRSAPSPTARLRASWAWNAPRTGRSEPTAHQRTSVDGVYACGDIVDDTLNQIAVAAGHAAIAATAIHNSL